MNRGEQWEEEKLVRIGGSKSIDVDDGAAVAVTDSMRRRERKEKQAKSVRCKRLAEEMMFPRHGSDRRKGRREGILAHRLFP